MQAPSLGGVSVPRGDGETVVRMRRGASLTDFADKIETPTRCSLVDRAVPPR